MTRGPNRSSPAYPRISKRLRMPHTSKPIRGVPVEVRRAQVKFLHDHGSSQIQIANELAVSRSVIRTDFVHLRLTRFSKLDSNAIRELVRTIILDSHRSAGRRYLDGQLRARHVILPRRRLRQALVELGALRKPPRRIRRRAWYEAYGPNWYY